MLRRSLLLSAAVLGSLGRAFWTEPPRSPIEICVDIEDSAAAAGREGPGPFLSRCRELGAGSAAMSWKDWRNSRWERVPGIGFGQDSLAPAVVLREEDLSGPAPPGTGAAPSAEPGTWILAATTQTRPSGQAVPDADALAALSRGTAGIALVERSASGRAPDRLKEEAARFPERVVRAHAIEPREAARLGDEAEIARWVRAAVERRCALFYLRWDPAKSPDDNLLHLSRLVSALRSRGLSVGRLPPAGDSRRSYPFRNARLVLAFLVSVLAPWAAFLAVRDRIRSYRETDPRAAAAAAAWGEALLLSLLGGLLVRILLPDSDFTNGLSLFRGVKAAILLPFLLSGWALVRGPGFRGGAVFWTAVAAFAAAALYRSGNTMSAPPFELAFRSWLEAALGVRPRFKEFLIGHPLLIAGIFLGLARAGADGKRSFGGREGWAVWLGGIGPVSIVNTFCHLHAPLAVSLVRTFHGAWLGAAAGAALLLVLRPKGAGR